MLAGLVLQGLRGKRKSKHGALTLYMGNGMRAAVEAIRSYDLVLPSGLIIILDNCHFAPSITRGVVSISRLVDNGYIHTFTNYGISVSRDNEFYFNAIPRDGIYVADMQNIYPSVSSIYNVSNKRAKPALDSTYLWHCHLGHINKKRMDKLQHDGILQPTHDESLEKCRSCISGKMACKPFPHQVERAKDYDFSRYGYVYLMKHKHKVIETFKVYQNEVENQLDKKIKAIRSDRGGEYLSHEFVNDMKICGIVSQLTPPYTPQHNGVPERRNQTLLDMVQFMMNMTTLPKSFWGYALEYAARILNMVPTKKVERTPYEIWHGKAPNLSYLKVTTSTIYSRTRSLLLEMLSSLRIVSHYKKQVGVTDHSKSTRIPQALDRYGFYVDVEEHELGDLNKPPNYKAALSDPKSDKWLEAMNTKMQSLKDNQVWYLVDLTPNGRTVGSKWLFNKKTDMDDNKHTFKARLVAKWYTQTYDVDYGETFSPVIDIIAIRILLAIATFYDNEIWQMDVKTTFINGHLSEDIYIVQPEGRFQQNSGEYHWTAVKNILKYLRNTKDMVLIYMAKPEAELKVSCNADASFQTNTDDTKSQTGYVFILNGGAVDRKSAKQSTIAMSSIKAEYIAAAKASMEAVWMRKFINGLGDAMPSNKRPMEMLCDNEPSIAMVSDPKIMKGARHFQRKYHYIREVIQDSEIILKKVHTYDNVADPFTKPMSYNKHYEYAMVIGIYPSSSLM
ncbi:RNA-directed DNA polymerase, eukaryota [Tanacetum coccineum]